MKHALATGHNVVMSFEPLQRWFFNYEKRHVFRARNLLAPLSRPSAQAAPGPPERVPHKWEDCLNEC